MRNRRSGMKMKAVNIMILLLVMFGCAKKADEPFKAIAGETGSKKWEAVKQTDVAGKKEKLDKEEKKEVMQFYSNGTFTIHGMQESSQGTWTYEPASKNLSLKFGSQNFTENFTVLELKEDEMKLKAGDGSMLTMEEIKE